MIERMHGENLEIYFKPYGSTLYTGIGLSFSYFFFWIIFINCICCSVVHKQTENACSNVIDSSNLLDSKWAVQDTVEQKLSWSIRWKSSDKSWSIFKPAQDEQPRQMFQLLLIVWFSTKKKEKRKNPLNRNPTKLFFLPLRLSVSICTVNQAMLCHATVQTYKYCARVKIIVLLSVWTLYLWASLVPFNQCSAEFNIISFIQWVKIQLIVDSKDLELSRDERWNDQNNFPLNIRKAV